MTDQVTLPAAPCPRAGALHAPLPREQARVGPRAPPLRPSKATHRPLPVIPRASHTQPQHARMIIVRMLELAPLAAPAE